MVLSVSCFYDPSSDRRSKAYCRKRSIEGAKGLVESPSHVLQPDDHDPQDGQFSQEEDAQIVLGVGSHVASSSTITEHVSLSLGQSLSHIDPTSDNLTPSDAPGRNLSSLIGPNLSDVLICTSNCALLSSTYSAQWYPQSLQSKQLVVLRQPVHHVPAYQIPDASPLSRSYTSFVSAAEQVSQSGLPLYIFLGDISPNVDLLFRPQISSDLLTSATWACETTKNFIPFDIYTQIAYVFLISRFMRWTLSPTFEHWILLPPIMRPTTLQRCVPHYPSADIQPLPVIREAMIRGECTLLLPVGNTQRAGTQRIKLYWPFGMDAALKHDPVTGATVLSRLFAEAAADESNWSCGIDFLKGLSEAGQGVYNVIVHMHGWNEVKT